MCRCMNLELSKMTDTDKLKMIGKLWDSIKEPHLIPNPEEHLKILETRLNPKDENIQEMGWL